MKPYAYLGSNRGIMQLAHLRILFDTRDVGLINILSAPEAAVYEADVWAFIQRAVKPGTTFVDVGANVGIHACLAASLIRGNGSVLAFEPNPRLAGMLKDNLAINGVGTRWQVFEEAVYSARGRMPFTTQTEQHRVGALVIEGARNYGAERYEVDVVTLDERTAGLSPDQDVVIKIDVEGREGGVLRGASALLARKNVSVIMEYHRDVIASTGEEVADLLRMLASLGYRPAILLPPPNLQREMSVDDLLNFGQHANLIWRREGQ